MPKLVGIGKKYGDRSIFEGFNLEMADGKVSVIMGASGVGKTTLLNILAGLLPFDGEAVVARPVSYVFQSPRLIGGVSVRDNLRFVLGKTDKAKADEIISDVLGKVGLGDKADAFPENLSGGEKQRLSFARAFVYESETLLADEPFSSLDYALKLQIMNLLTDLLKNAPKTSIIVTHDVDEAVYLSDRVVVMTPRPGRITSTLDIQLARPRARSSEDFLNTRAEILRRLHYGGTVKEPNYYI